MAKQQIFEYAILYHPTEKKDSDGNPIKQIISFYALPLQNTSIMCDIQLSQIHII